MQRNSNEFKQLQDEWDSKLKDSGFEDAETRDGNLKVWTISRTMQLLVKNKSINSNTARLDYSQSIQSKIEEREYYYRIAGHFLHEYKFINEIDKLIWGLHSDGLSHRTITRKLKTMNIQKTKTSKHTDKIKILPYGKASVLAIITRLNKEMLRLYASGNSE